MNLKCQGIMCLAVFSWLRNLNLLEFTHLALWITSIYCFQIPNAVLVYLKHSILGWKVIYEW